MSAFSDIGRRSGILLHITSLPSRFGIGDFGPGSRWFVDFLCEAKQRIWCILPLGPTGRLNSPYDTRSAFAGNPLLISTELLAEQGYVSSKELQSIPAFSLRSVQFSSVRRYKQSILKKAYAGFSETRDFHAFVNKNSWWIEDFAAFMSLREGNGGAPWTKFDKRIKPNSDSVRYHKFLQYEFFRQWSLLHELCRTRGIAVLGDLPFYVEQESADVWAHPELFDLDRQGCPKTVGGVPPDYFSRNGQRWGTPTYHWKRLAGTGFRWWIDRLRFAFETVDLLRLDHFRGFQAFWSVPARCHTAKKGRWVIGPGEKLFSKARKELGDRPIIAENLGLITPKVEALREQFSFPGMAVLQFAFGEDGTHRPNNYVRNLAAFSCTHDNDTTVGWCRSLRRSASEADRAASERACSYLQSDGKQIHWDFIRAVLTSVAQIAIIPMQDLLGLSSIARMNQPGRAENNWKWRCEAKLVNSQLAQRLASLTLASDR